jgi:hypothetical protein
MSRRPDPITNADLAVLLSLMASLTASGALLLLGGTLPSEGFGVVSAVLAVTLVRRERTALRWHRFEEELNQLSAVPPERIRPRRAVRRRPARGRPARSGSR